MEKIKIGKIVNAVGLKGEVKVYHYSDYKERFEELDQIWIGGQKVTIEGVRYMKDMVILKLAGVSDRNGAEALKEQEVFIDESMLRVLPEDTYYIKDLIGMEVASQKEGRIGILTDVIQNSSQDLYEVTTEDGRKIFIPAVEEFIRDIDCQNRKITVELIEGLLEL